MKRGTPDHPKTIDLAKRLGVPRYVAVGILESLWHFTAEFAPQGNIGKFTDAAIAGHLHWEKTCKELIAALIESKWVDKCAKNRLIVHDWKDHADQTVKRWLEKRSLEFLIPQLVTRNRHASTKLADASMEKADPPPQAGLPLPKPLPEPVPLPVALPAQALIVLPPSAERLIGETAERMYARHPKKRNWPLVPGVLKSAVMTVADPAKQLEEIESVHEAWVAAHDWTKDGGRFAPKLDEWIADKGFTAWPPGHARNRPSQKLNLYNPPWLAEVEAREKAEADAKN